MTLGHAQAQSSDSNRDPEQSKGKITKLEIIVISTNIKNRRIS
jgi:hypothetical protein